MLTFDINDVAGPDFYELQVFIDGRLIDIETLDPSGSEGLDSRTLLFRDDSFDGSRKTVQVSFNRFFFTEGVSSEIMLRWISVNEGYFLLSKSVERQDAASDNPFATAVQINTNVNEALGVIGFRNGADFIINP